MNFCCERMKDLQDWSPNYINFEQDPPIMKLVNQKDKRCFTWTYLDYCPFCGKNI